MKDFRGFRAERLKIAMKENGVTDNDIVKALREADCRSKERVFKILEGIFSGEYTLSLKEFFVICKTVNCSADYLLGLSDEMYQ